MGLENGSLTSVAVVVVVGIVERVGPCPDCMREKLERGAVDGEMEYQSRLSGTPCLWFADVSVSSQTLGLCFTRSISGVSRHYQQETSAITFNDFNCVPKSLYNTNSVL